MQNTNKAIYKLHKNQKGQTLLFVVVAMTIALSVGINASVRTLSSLSRTSRTDTASRALAAAEGGIERYLALSKNELEKTIDVLGGGPGNCPEGTVIGDSGDKSCLIEFEGSSDVLVSQAYVKVERYTPDYYPFSLESGQLKEVSLYNEDTGFQYADSAIEICWTSTPSSDLMYTSYNSDGIKSRGGLTGANPSGLPYQQDGFDTANAGKTQDGYTYDNCETVDIGGADIYGLRIRSVGGSSDIAVFPTGGATLPLQGYRIESIGKIRQDQAVTASRAIKVVRTLPYLPVSFDYALYSEGGIVK